MTVIGWLATGLAALVILVTLLPFSRSKAGWIRMWDFPRPQIAAVAIAALLLLGIAGFAGERPLLMAALAVGVAAALGFQLQHIFHYTPMARKQAAPASRSSGDDCLSLMTVNVYQFNRKSERLVELAKRYDPDILLAVETDLWWRDELEPVAQNYPHVASMPLDNTYGMIFMTRLEPVGPIEFRFIIKEGIPSIRVELKLRNGETIVFYGLHPEPPTPIEDSEDRDMELIAVARELAEEKHPALVAGDLNDVAWSPTTRRFKRLSGTLDPRVGRGLYATFHAKIPGMSWPLDHLFHTPDFTISELDVLPDVGSDHFPIFARLCLEKGGTRA